MHKTPHKYSHQNLFAIIRRLPAPTKAIVQLEYQEKLYLEIPLVASNAHILTPLFCQF